MVVQLGGKAIWAGLPGLRLRCEKCRLAAGGCHRASLMIKRSEAAAAIQPGPAVPFRLTAPSFPQVTHQDRSGGPVLPPLSAYAGLRSVSTPDTPPTAGMAGSTSPPIAMYALGAYGTMGILAALWRARETGTGGQLEVAGIDVATSWMPDAVDAKLNEKNVVPRPGWLPDGRLPDWPRLEAYRTHDGAAILLGAHVEKFWRNFCHAVNRTDLLGIDLSTADEGAAERAEGVWRELRDIFATRTRAEWIDLFLEHDIAGGPVNSFEDVIHDPHFRARHNTYTTGDATTGPVELLVSPVRLDGEDFAPGPAPELGADTYDVLRNVAGYDHDTAAAF